MEDKKDREGHPTVLDEVEAHPETVDNVEDFNHQFFEENDPEFLEMMKRHGYSGPEEDEEAPEFHDKNFDEDYDDSDEEPA